MVASSRVTSQNQISIPAEVRKRWGIVPGTELIWEERDGELVVRPKRHSLDDLRAFGAEHGIRALPLTALRAARDRTARAKVRRGRR